eukprot:2649995-Prymnesium_polylepis.2
MAGRCFRRASAAVTFFAGTATPRPPPRKTSQSMPPAPCQMTQSRFPGAVSCLDQSRTGCRQTPPLHGGRSEAAVDSDDGTDPLPPERPPASSGGGTCRRPCL